MIREKEVEVIKISQVHIGIYILGAFVLLVFIIIIQYNKDIRNSYDRLNNYKTNKISTEFGKMTYMDEGIGEAILISHGIFGGYDQAYNSLKSFVEDNYRKIGPSRFGYPGSDLPVKPTPGNQAKAFLNLLDQLEIEKTYIITTSAGSASGIKFAIDYPKRVKGLILLSSAVPNVKKTKDEIEGMTGPPKFLVNDFPMWFSTKYFGFIFKSMFGSEIDKTIYNTMLPVSPRKKGIEIDGKITNIDMDINFDDYKIEKIQAPILVLHAKDDPMTKYENINEFINLTNAKNTIFETGGHLITGHKHEVSKTIKNFIEDFK